MWSLSGTCARDETIIQTTIGNFICSSSRLIEPTLKRAIDLVPGDEIICDPIDFTFSENTIEQPWLIGYLHGAQFISGKPFYVYSDEIIGMLITYTNKLGIVPNINSHTICFDLDITDDIPECIFSSSVETRDEFCKGFLTSGYPNASYETLQKIQYLYASLGIKSKVSTSLKENYFSFCDDPVRVLKI